MKIGKYSILHKREVDEKEEYEHYYVRLDIYREEFELKLFNKLEYSLEAQNRVLNVIRIVSSLNFSLVQKYFDCFAIDEPIRFA